MDAKIESFKQTNNDQTHVTVNRQQQKQKQQPMQQSLKKSNDQLKSTINKSIKHCSKISKQKHRFHPKPKQNSAKSTCTRCGHGKLVDITYHEFPMQQGLLFECVSCGNNSMRSNVSADERQRRIAKVAADHLTKVTCQFCQQTFLAHNDYLMHLKNDHASDKPIILSSVFFFMELNVGHIVWARQNKDNIYWPAKIAMKSNSTNDLWSTELFDNFQQQSTYLIELFITNQSFWTTDILQYSQYRESMANHSFINYGLHPAMKQDFLNAVYQADYAISNEMYTHNNYITPRPTTMPHQSQSFLSTFEDNTDNNSLLMTSPEITSNTGYYDSSYQPSMDWTNQSLDKLITNNSNTAQILTTTNDWYEQQGLFVESITPPISSENDSQLELIPSANNYQKENSIIIITSKIYSNSSFISHLFNCLSNVFQPSIIYIEDIIHYQHPHTVNITYLISFDYFNSTIQQTLNSTILNNLNAHINYLFLIINSPSYDLIRHFYSTITDTRSIVILQYHTTFDNEPLLLCSGNRTTFDKIQSSFLKYLCTKIKYIESSENENEQLFSAYCISSIIQSTNILNNFINEKFQETLNGEFESDFLNNNQSVINELFPRVSTSKPTNNNNNNNNLLELIHNSNEDIVTNKSKQAIVMNGLFQNRAIKTRIPPTICEYYVQNILHEKK
ncbi:unnamed protein product [Rotaria socialis]|nr:unnamed protein product [Rotaria socialis]